MKKGIVCILLLCLSFECFMNAQDRGSTLDGIVISRDTKERLQFVNVAIFSSRDSLVVNGAITDSLGKFSLTLPTEGEWYIEASLIGYKTAKIAGCPDRADIIELQYDEQLLDAAIVKSSPYSNTNNGMVAIVDGTSLSKLGTANTVLRHLPFVNVKNENLEVFGRGTPLVYIDKREVRDLKELNNLNSEEIQKIEVITTPGPEYDASVGSVILIYKKKNRVGISGDFFTQNTFRRVFSTNDRLAVHYNKQNFEVGGSINYIAANEKFVQQDYYAWVQYYLEEISNQRISYNTFNPIIYSVFSKNEHSFGVRYEILSEPNEQCGIMNNVIEGIDITDFPSKVETYDDRYASKGNQRINAYYNWAINSISFLRIDFDYIDNNGFDGQNLKYNENDGKTPSEVKTSSSTNGKLLSSRIVYFTPFLGGYLKVGGDYARTTYNQHFSAENLTFSGEQQIIQNYMSQNKSGLFSEYSVQIDKLSLNAGLRVDKTSFKWFSGEGREHQQSKNYLGIYPNIIINYVGDSMHHMLSYKRTTNRPSYWALRNSLSCTNPFLYETGNPLLLNANNDQISYMLEWGDFNFLSTYSMLSNAICTTLERYSTTSPMLIMKPINIETLSNVAISFSYSPSINLWNPEFEVSMYKQFLDGFGQPIFEFNFNNEFSFEKSGIGCDFNYSTCGNNKLVYYANDFLMGVYVYKSFLNERLRLNIQLDNVLNTSKDKWSINVNDIYLKKYSNQPSTAVILSLTYNFNTSASKYKGQESSDEIKRL